MAATPSAWAPTVRILKQAGLSWKWYRKDSSGITCATVVVNSLEFLVRVGNLPVDTLLPVPPTYVFAYDLNLARAKLDRLIPRACWRIAAYKNDDGSDTFWLEYVLLDSSEESGETGVLALVLNENMYDKAELRHYLEEVQRFFGPVAK